MKDGTQCFFRNTFQRENRHATEMTGENVLVVLRLLCTLGAPSPWLRLCGAEVPELEPSLQLTANRSLNVKPNFGRRSRLMLSLTTTPPARNTNACASSWKNWSGREQCRAKRAVDRGLERHFRFLKEGQTQQLRTYPQHSLQKTVSLTLAICSVRHRRKPLRISRRRCASHHVRLGLVQLSPLHLHCPQSDLDHYLPPY